MMTPFAQAYNEIRDAVREVVEEHWYCQLFLASDRSAKTTGCTITVDGGVREAFPR